MRNNISFHDDIDTVQNALYRIISYLDSLPSIPKENGSARFYAIDGDYIYIDEFPKMKLNKSLKIPGLSENESGEFISLVSFLKKNFITSASESRYKFWFFEYRKLDYPGDEDFRDIIVVRHNNDTIGLYVENKIIDHSKNLLLVAPKSREEFLKNYNEIKKEK